MSEKLEREQREALDAVEKECKEKLTALLSSSKSTAEAEVKGRAVLDEWSQRQHAIIDRFQEKIMQGIEAKHRNRQADIVDTMLQQAKTVEGVELPPWEELCAHDNYKERISGKGLVIIRAVAEAGLPVNQTIQAMLDGAFDKMDGEEVADEESPRWRKSVEDAMDEFWHGLPELAQSAQH